MPDSISAFGGVQSALTSRHPLYDQWLPTWEKLFHCYHGTGGFSDGGFLIAHPLEWLDASVPVTTSDPMNGTPVTTYRSNPAPSRPSPKLLARRRLARYENVARLILNQKRSALFRESVSRSVGPSDKKEPHPLEVWWEDVNGRGMGIDDWMAESWVAAAIFGYVIQVMDREAMPVAPLTKADEGDLYLRMYTPPDMPDWLTDAQGELTGVQLTEAKPRVKFSDPVNPGPPRERQIDEVGWRVLEDGKELSSGQHGFGALPVVLHYSQRRPLSSIVGLSVLGDPKLHIDLFNLRSECRELLRNQTFSILNIELGTGDQKTSIEQAQAMVGKEVGSMNVLFTPGPAQFIQADTANVEAYQQECEQLIRLLYRLTATPYESDSKDAEAQGSMELKREDMAQALAAAADECERAEYQLAQLWFRATYGPDAWEAAWDEAAVVIRYPDTFGATPAADLIEQALAAMGLQMGPLFMAEQLKRIVDAMTPDLPPDKRQDIFDQIDESTVQAHEQNLQQKEGELKVLETQGKAPPKAKAA